MKRTNIIIMTFIAFLLSAVLSGGAYAKEVKDERTLTVPQGGKESFTVDITDNGALTYDMTIDASEGDIVVYSPRGTSLDTLHFTSADMPVHRYVPVSQGTYTVEITTPASSTGSGAVTASLEYEGNSKGGAIYETVDTIKAVLIAVGIAVLSIVFAVLRIVGGPAGRAWRFFRYRGGVNNVTLFRDDFNRSNRWPF